MDGSQSGHSSARLNRARPPSVPAMIVSVTKRCLSRRCLGSRPTPTRRKNKMPRTGMKITAMNQAMAAEG